MSLSHIPSDWSSLNTLNPELIELLQTLPPNFQLVTPTTTTAELRARGAARPKSDPWPGIRERDLYIAMRDGFQNRVRVYTRENEDGNGKGDYGPLLVMIHGGGFCVGRAEQEDENCRKWVRDHRGVAVSIEHRLAPEAKFPVPVEDCWDSLRWIAANARSLMADPRKGFVLGGAYVYLPCLFLC